MQLQNNRSTDGSETFWPGYVDAISNLVLNLLFLLIIMTVGIFMFGLEIGKTTSGVTAAQSVWEYAGSSTKPTETEKEDYAELSGRAKPGRETVIVPATVGVKPPEKNVAESSMNPDEVIVRFVDDAITLNEQEEAKLREALKAITAKAKANILCVVPAGFSEARRMGYYRAMAVRNLLIDMKVPPQDINLNVREGGRGANASLVRVTGP